MSFRFIRYYMDIAKRSAEMSHAKRLKVGAVIVKDNKIISTSWNGTPSGEDNNCEHEVDGKLTTKPEVAHAEEMAISKLARDGISCLAATMYITHAPCMQCARLIYNAGICSIYYEKSYRDSTGVEFLQKRGISVQKLGDSVQETVEKVEKTSEKPVTQKFTREKFGKLLKSNSLIMINREYLPVNIELFGIDAEKCWRNGEAGNITVGVYSLTNNKYLLYKSAIHETRQEVFEELADVLYNMYLREEIFVQEGL